MSDRRTILALGIALLAAVALAISGYLTWTIWQSGQVAGCTAESSLDCGDVLASRWSKWLGLPVSLLGALNYLVLLVLALAFAWWPRPGVLTAMLALVLLAICSAVWFVSIQAVLLQSFCLYCLTVHGCALVLGGFTWALCRDPHALAQPDPMGLLLGGDQEFLEEDDAPQSLPLRGWLTSLAVAAAGLLVLMGGQLLFTPEVAMVMEEVEFAPPAVETPAPLANPPAEAPAQVNQPVLASPAVPAQDLPRLYAIRALSEPVDLATMPMLGRLNAEHVMVEMMDYTCEHCRLIHPHVRAALDRYGDQLSVVIHHVPLSKKCNPHVPIPKDYPGKKYACDYAQLAIGVWNLAPEEFPAFHDWLLTGEKPPSPTEARQRALRLVGEAVLLDKQVKADIKRRLAEQATVFKSLRSGLPILLFADGALRGVPEESEKLFEYLETKLGIEPR